MSDLAARPKSPLPIPGESSSMRPEEIFQRIELVQQSLEPEPGFLEQLISPGARREAAAIASARVSAIQARRDVIDGLRGCIKTYIDAHQGDLRVRGAAFVLETLVKQCNSLNVMVEDSYASLYTTYDESVEKYERIRHLSDDQKTTLKQEALQRTRETMELNKQRFNQVLDDIRRMVSTVVQEMGILRKD